MASSRSSNRFAPWPDRYWVRVDRSAGPDACWPWTGPLGRDGYGLTYALPLGKRTMSVHRVAYLLAHPGEAPSMVLHSCDTPLCCNALHLFAGDQAANMADMKAKGRANGGRAGGPWVKVDEKQRQVILLERQAGRSVRDLGAKHGLTAPGIRYVLKMALLGTPIRRRNRTNYLGN